MGISLPVRCLERKVKAVAVTQLEKFVRDRDARKRLRRIWLACSGKVGHGKVSRMVVENELKA
ncbi:hypothetical protein A4R26_15160 [Niastella populi]|uniref:Uncharacterized protein n=1 Tax=Niastella populi TaxID=550983 RepID=A0A1V9G326_9BACT|nr:hypothetical protein A4R26_15160 [Niastella populi]